MVVMKAEYSKWWSRRGYMAITLFGHVITGSRELADELNGEMGPLMNHEMIHLRQAQSTGNSWWRFYLLYGWFSLAALRYCRKVKNSAYVLNPFEMEAYKYMYDMDYLKRNNGLATAWREYRKMTLNERLKVLGKK